MIVTGGRGGQVLTGSDGDDRIYGSGDTNTNGSILAMRVATGLAFPTFAGNAPGDAGALYITEKASGQIVRLDLGSFTKTTYLDIPDDDLRGSGEGGLLSIAFHPDYATNGKVFAYVTNAAGDIEIRSYVRNDGSVPPTADPASKTVLLTIPHPTYLNHYGGQLQFGPDGYLYISVGDGGGSNDPGQNAQNLDSLLGKLLRIDVNADDFPDDATRNYAIPVTNPFAGATAGADEIFAYGLRNPWRFSFDSATGDMWIADVGQNAREEVNRIPAGSAGGQNFGWRILEGTRVNFPGATDGMVAPVFEYDHEFGRSITGGYVYRGPDAGLTGDYILADFATNKLLAVFEADGVMRSVDITDRIWTDVGVLTGITSFAVDAQNRLYVLTLSGNIYWLRPTEGADDGDDFIDGGAGNDVIFGSAGNDVLIGGSGNDSLNCGLGSNKADGGDGDDFIFGGDGKDSLQGGTGNDRVYGNAGNDAMVGGDGNDLLSGGPDDDLIRGNAGTDTIYGGEGLDRISGGLDADRIFGGEDGDIIRGDGGDDRVLGDAGNDRLYGDDGADVLDGGSGNDNMAGGAGDDRYFVDAALDVTLETDAGIAGGIDTVTSTISRTLSANIENLVLTGSASNGIGNALANFIKGNTLANTIAGLDGNDLIAGGGGNDYLVGGIGRDAFVFDTTLSASLNKDRIGDFVAADDTIRMDDAVFTTAGPAGFLAAAAFWSSSTGTAHDVSDRIIYHTTTGALLYDADGTGTEAAVEFARLSGAPTISAADLVVF